MARRGRDRKPTRCTASLHAKRGIMFSAHDLAYAQKLTSSRDEIPQTAENERRFAEIFARVSNGNYSPFTRYWKKALDLLQRKLQK